MTHNNDDNKFGASIPGFETDQEGNIVPEGTLAERELDALYHLADDDDLDDWYDDEDIPRAWNRFHESERVARRASFDSENAMLSDITESRLRKASKQHKAEMEKPATQGWKGSFNKALPFMKLKATDAERKQRKSEYIENVARIRKTTINRAHKEIARAALDIMVTDDGKYRCPAVGVGSQKGGSGKTTTIVALAEFYARALAWKQKKQSAKLKPAVIIDLNPDVGTIVSRVPDTVNEYGNKLNSLELGQLCMESDEQQLQFDAMEYTFPTKWRYLRAIPNPVDKSDRSRMSRAKIESIYDHLSDQSSMVFMDNGTRIDSQQSISSANISNAFVLVIDAGSDANFVVSEVRDWNAMASDNVSFKGISERMVVAIVVKTDSDVQRKNAVSLRKKLAADNVDSVILPFESSLANNAEIEFSALSAEYQSAIAALAHHILGNLNKG